MNIFFIVLIIVFFIILFHTIKVFIDTDKEAREAERDKVYPMSRTQRKRKEKYRRQDEMDRPKHNLPLDLVFGKRV